MWYVYYFDESLVKYNNVAQFFYKMEVVAITKDLGKRNVVRFYRIDIEIRNGWSLRVSQTISSHGCSFVAHRESICHKMSPVPCIPTRRSSRPIDFVSHHFVSFSKVKRRLRGTVREIHGENSFGISSNLSTKIDWLICHGCKDGSINHANKSKLGRSNLHYFER